MIIRTINSESNLFFPNYHIMLGHCIIFSKYGRKFLFPYIFRIKQFFIKNPKSWRNIMALQVIWSNYFLLEGDIFNHCGPNWLHHKQKHFIYSSTRFRMLQNLVVNHFFKVPLQFQEPRLPSFWSSFLSEERNERSNWHVLLTLNRRWAPPSPCDKKVSIPIRSCHCCSTIIHFECDYSFPIVVHLFQKQDHAN